MLQIVVPLAMPMPPRSFDHDTSVTPTSSEAVPLKLVLVVLLVKLGPEVGLVMEMAGGAVSPETTQE